MRRILTVLATIVIALYALVVTGCRDSSPTAVTDPFSQGSFLRMSERDTDRDGMIDLNDDDDDNDGLDDDQDGDDDNDGIADEDEADWDDDGTIDDHDDDFVEIRGFISSIGDSEFVVFGHRIVVTDSTRLRGDDNQPITFGDLIVGMEVEVHGALMEDGSVIAVEVEVEDDLDDPEDDLSLGDVAIGDWVQAKGIRDGGSIRLIELKRHEQDNEFEYEGAIEATGEGSITLGGVEIVFNDDTEFRDDAGTAGALADLEAGDRVDIRVWAFSNPLLARRIRTEDNGEVFIKVEAPVDAVNESTGSITVGKVMFSR